ncbi:MULTISPECIES: hypothetical protein [Pseudomonas syringae group]|uniref:Uncharacterized protein n=1 Tax=Pseudomonas coronafaciens pv. coronafaciens TaxID=235275 RepID=A0AAE6QDC6_9PSED|nr:MULTISPECIES: hypothetical protein [Pseudomonas syringae group]MCF5713326.1 hypothetical protein [Pseudomonas tremae]MCF5743492.1 hypothetical protein [Pseudomonas tremae]QGT80672.1 hypothetical protein GMO17_05525 [Pseudomonas coronafaciens pv. coronafaciens]QIQ73475.1 hypothetical protein HBB04_03881 [Pseudomonas coronafaciens]RMM86281.1 hypothetical protein ALQ71_02610 [Pseudomonas coronafaciens pv. striafaciens]
MEEIDDLTRKKIREWQGRRSEIKSLMQSNPDRTMELSHILDLMDEEHAAILSGSTERRAEDNDQQSAILHALNIKHSLRIIPAKCDLQLYIAASSPEDLRKLLEIAVYELQGRIDAEGAVAGEHRNYPGSMSGTLGNYHFELDIEGESGDE